jgi:Outer membrane protein beta-barrel family/Carboxypeptidase regulatory-like domain
MKKIAVLFLLAGFTLGSSAQSVTGIVRGKIVDTASKQSLTKASLSIIDLSDSSTTANAEATKGGTFEIKGLGEGRYRLLVTFQGYQNTSKIFSVTKENPVTDFGTIVMERKSDVLQEVIVERVPMSVKKDTVEYSAGAFTVKPNAVAEDLLKKLPGVQVDKSGAITAQGEKVTRILVNGKRFFSDDPKLATRNLPPDIIDKIQVFDDLSDQSKFTGFDDGNRVKTINITTKKDKQQGYFGKAVAGAGTDGNYDESINLHRFKGNQQISVLGQANDVNKQNFTPQDILGNSGGRRGGGGGGGGGGQSGSGITTVWAGGLNYRDAWSPNTDAYGSYFFNSQHVSVHQLSSTQKFFQQQDSSTFTNQDQSNIQRTQNQRINFNLEQRFDSSNSLIFRPAVTFQNSSPNASSVSSTADDKGVPINTSIAHSASSNSGFNINGANLQFRHKFNKKFRTISLDLNTTANVNDGTGYNYALNNFYRLNSIDTINQFYNDSLHSISFSPTLSYTEPIGKNQILEFNYNYTYNRNNTVNNTYDYSNASHDFKSFDSLFSNSYKFTSNSNRFSLNYRIQNTKFNLGVGSGIQFTGFNSLNTTKDITVAHNYINLTPTVNFQYTFSKTRHLRFNYSGRTGTPSASQLQPLTTTSDEINYQVGNPALKPQFTHSLRMLYTSFDPVTQRVMFATINASTIVNDIQSAIVPNAKGGQTSTYVNLNGTYNLSGYFNYGFALKKPKSNLNFITNVNYSQSQTLQGDSSQAVSNSYIHNYTKNTTLAETISWTTNLKKNFDMNFSSASTYNIATNARQNLNYFSQILSAEITAYTNSGWTIATNFDYTYTNNRTPGYNASVPLLSPSIAKQLFKKKNGELRLSVFDLLNQNTSVSKTVSLTQSVDTRTNTLTRYAMLTFTYNLNNFAGAQQKRMPGMFPRGGGGMRGNRGGNPIPF